MIADGEHFLEAVRNVHDRDPARLQVADQPEQHPDFGCAQGGGGFVHDEDADVLRNRLGDLDDLLVAQRQRAHQNARIDGLLQAGHEVAGLALLRVAVEDAVSRPLAPQKDVVGHAEVGEQIQFLVDHGNAAGRRIARGCQANGASIQFQSPGGRLLDSGQDAHQRGLARAVLADQGADLAATHGEIHAVQSRGARVLLGDGARRQDHIGRHGFSFTTRVTGTISGSSLAAG